MLKTKRFLFITLYIFNSLLSLEPIDDSVSLVDLSVYDGEGSLLLLWSYPDSILAENTKIYSKQSNQITFNLISELIKIGANPDRSGPNNETPIIIASRFGNFEAVKALLEGGAYPDDTDLTGRTALQWAKIKHYKRIKEVLIEYGAYDN